LVDVRRGRGHQPRPRVTSTEAARPAVESTAGWSAPSIASPSPWWWPVPVAAVTVLAGGLRLVSLKEVPLDPFYDAAVRSMALSWHNLFFGAFEPGGTVAIDKTPL